MQETVRIGRLAFAIEFAVFLVGIYFAYQYQVSKLGLPDPGKVDILFVLILIAATAFLLPATTSVRSYILRRGFNYWQYVLPDGDGDHIERSLRGLIASCFWTLGRVIGGVLYGGVIVTGADLLRNTAGLAQNRFEFDAFLFCMNYLTGATLYSLTTFLAMGPALIRNIPVQLWDTRNPASEFLFNSNARIGVYASLYVGLCMTSIIFSDIPRDFLVYAYVGFSSVIALVTIVAPFYFYARRIQFFKDRLVTRIGKMLDQLSAVLLSDGSKSAHPNEFHRMQELVQLREWVSNADVLPFRLRSLYAAITMVLFSLQPFFVDVVRSLWEQ